MFLVQNNQRELNNKRWNSDQLQVNLSMMSHNDDEAEYIDPEIDLSDYKTISDDKEVNTGIVSINNIGLMVPHKMTLSGSSSESDLDLNIDLLQRTSVAHRLTVIQDINEIECVRDQTVVYHTNSDTESDDDSLAEYKIKL